MATSTCERSTLSLWHAAPVNRTDRKWIFFDEFFLPWSCRIRFQRRVYIFSIFLFLFSGFFTFSYLLKRQFYVKFAPEEYLLPLSKKRPSRYWADNGQDDRWAKNRTYKRTEKTSERMAAEKEQEVSERTSRNKRTSKQEKARRKMEIRNRKREKYEQK